MNKTTAGTGIGLALTKDLVSLMEGSINTSSKLNKGTSIEVTLPVVFVKGLSDTHEVDPNVIKNIQQAQSTIETEVVSIVPTNKLSKRPLVLLKEENGY